MKSEEPQGSRVTRRAVVYLRVSTNKQRISGLGMEAQRETVRRFLAEGWHVLDEVTEVESGRVSNRPELDRALALCRVHKATLVIARLDRLTRDPYFLSGLELAGIEFVVCDMPSANRFTINIMAAVAAEEARAISERTRLSLAAARARGVILGDRTGRIAQHAVAGGKRSASARRSTALARAADLAPIVLDIQGTGAASLAQVTEALNARRIPAPRGIVWHRESVRRLQQQIAGL